ncbi:MAG: TonB-dependent receptor [Kofleriaceae bacterium]|nr:TonB-dependent receptor [Kofleriaceae bacterium]
MHRALRRAGLTLLAAGLVGVPGRARADGTAADPGLFGFEPEPAADAPAVACGEPRPWWCVLAPGPDPEPDPAALRQTLTRDGLRDHGAGDLPHDLTVAWALGASRDGGGVALAGASSLEHRWLLDGLPVDSPSTGGAGLHLPLAFVETLDVVTGGVGASSPAATGAVIDAHLRDGRVAATDVGVWLGAGAPRRVAPPYPGGYEPLALEADAARTASVSAVMASGTRPLWGGARWFVAGLETTLGGAGATRIARRLRDADGDGRYDRDAGVLATDVVDERHLGGSLLTSSAMARLGYQHGRHAVVVTGVGTLGLDDRRGAAGTADATRLQRDDRVLVGMVDWTSRWDATAVHVTAGWQHTSHAEVGVGAADQTVQIGTAYVPAPADLAADAAVAAACADDVTGDPLPGLVNCPLATGYYVRDGVGLAQDLAGDRPTVTAEVTHALRWHGRHRLAAGATAEDARLVLHRRFSGGAIERRLAEAVIFTSRFVELDPAGDADCGELGPCRFLDRTTTTYRTRHVAGWLEDTWRPQPDVTAQLGLRWESMEVAHDVRFRDQVAPRVAVAVDPGAAGDRRLFVSWARYFPLLPVGVGPTVSGVPDVYTHLATPIGDRDTLTPGDGVAVAADLESAPVDELVVGVERAFEAALRVGAAWRSRWMMRGVDEVAGTLVNPGTGGAAGLAPLTRGSHDLIVWLGNAPDARLHLQLGYVYGRELGSWNGAYDPAVGAALVASPFDGRTGNAWGPLPDDRPHRFYGDVATRRAVGPWALTAGARLTVSSGRPRSTLDGAGAPVLPRGDAGRLPVVASAIVHVGAARGRLRLALDVTNPFDRRTVLEVDDRYTLDDVGAIEGGDLTDLMWAKQADGVALTRHGGWGRATRYQAPTFVLVSAALVY